MLCIVYAPCYGKKVVFNTILCVWIRHYLYGCRSRSFHHQAKKTCFLLESWKSLTKRAGSGSGSVTQWHGSADPDPNQNVTDPQHCIKTIKYYQRKKAGTKIYEIITTMWEMQQIEYSMVRHFKKYDICRIEHSHSGTARQEKNRKAQQKSNVK